MKETERQSKRNLCQAFEYLFDYSLEKFIYYAIISNTMFRYLSREIIMRVKIKT